MRTKQIQIRDFNVKALASLIPLIGKYEPQSLKFFHRYIETCFEVNFYKDEDSIDRPENFKHWSKIFGTLVRNGYIGR